MNKNYFSQLNFIYRFDLKTEIDYFSGPFGLKPKVILKLSGRDKFIATENIEMYFLETQNIAKRNINNGKFYSVVFFFLINRSFNNICVKFLWYTLLNTKKIYTYKKIFRQTYLLNKYLKYNIKISI